MKRKKGISLMNRILTPIVAVFVSLFMLAGCTTDELAANCLAVEQTYGAFSEVASAGVSAGTLDKISRAKNVMDSICANPGNATTLSVAVAAAAAMLALRNGIAEAEANGADVGYPVEMRQLRGTLSKMQQELDRYGR
jgi:hypothetical protein